jgi:hypothetical protein
LVANLAASVLRCCPSMLASASDLVKLAVVDPVKQPLQFWP